MVMQWQNSLEFAPKTILNYRSVLNMILDMAYNDEIIERNPLTAVKPPKVIESLSDIYDLDEINILVDTAKGQFKNVLEFNFFSGMRPSELIALKWTKVNFDNHFAKIDERIRDGEIALPKGGKIRIIDLLPRAEKALKRQLELTAHKEYVFVSQYGNRYNTPDSLNDQFKKLCKKCGLREGIFYDTKDSFCTLMLENNMNETWLTQQIGHETISVTRKHYVGKIKPDFTQLNTKIS